MGVDFSQQVQNGFGFSKNLFRVGEYLKNKKI